MKKVKIVGAGSIGNHLAFACRSKDWDVLICDIDEKALKRTKDEIYPTRYSRWDDSIRLTLVKDIPKEDFDLVIIGTPPEFHNEYAINILKEEKPQVLLIEKPLCQPSLEKAQELFELSQRSNTKVLVGYNHVLAKSTIKVEQIIKEKFLGDFITLRGGFLEYWGGIFKAHPWLAGPEESYLGFTSKGGGASGEHSHALNIWQHFANVLEIGRIIEITATMDWITDGEVHYDRICNFNVKTEKGYCGQITQDVVTEPSKKFMYMQGDKGFIEWEVNKYPGCDGILFNSNEGALSEIRISKTRMDDFKIEIEHITGIMDGSINNSPISLERGLETMLVLAAANLSDKSKSAVEIDYNKGFTTDSIKILK